MSENSLLEDSEDSIEGNIEGNIEGRILKLTMSNSKCLSAAKFLISAGTDVNARDNSGATALLWACKRDRIELVQLLIDSGAKVNISLNDGWSPLMIAAEEGKIRVMNALISAGAEINHRSNRDPLH